MIKSALHLFVFLSAGLVLNSCDTTSTTVPQTVSFVFYDVFEQDSLIIRPDWVEVNGVQVQHNITTGYSLDIEEGTYQVVVNSPDHSFLDTTITVSKDTDAISLELDPKEITYFNPTVGEKWVFDYSDNVSYPNYDRIATSGTMVWEVIEQNLDQETNEPVFTVKNDLEAKKRRESFEGEPIDSSYIDDTSYFTIRIRNNGNVSYSRVKYITTFTSGVAALKLNGKDYQSPIRKSYPVSRLKVDPIIDVRYGNGSPLYRSSIAPEAGFIDFYIYTGGNTKYSTSLDLVSHSK
ncbi:hypothetical protein A8B79_04905 [Balneola sp. EhC07]|uniref:hypothetical protein n=1 Tax=Balneola sp. EhC07 TaxID=1849360 RepID=UPI0007F50CD3|nr:hypothetical protein [Balneola sp. EhC07]OAN61767.1 hypothetical protein A8B79_04905 [Balneola sp. EhC07]